MCGWSNMSYICKFYSCMLDFISGRSLNPPMTILLYDYIITPIASAATQRLTVVVQSLLMSAQCW